MECGTTCGNKVVGCFEVRGHFSERPKKEIDGFDSILKQQAFSDFGRDLEKEKKEEEGNFSIHHHHEH